MANVARLDLEPMSTGRSTTGNASGGGKRSKSGEFSSISDATTADNAAAKRPTSLSPTAPEIDSGWDESETRDSPALAKALAPRPVISIGPPAQTPTETNRADSIPSKGASTPSKEKRRQIESFGKDPKRRASIPPAESKSDVALLNRRSKPNVAAKISAKSGPSQDRSVLPPGVDSKALKKLLTEGAEGSFNASDIAQLVTAVMKSEPPAAAVPAASRSAQSALIVAKAPSVVARTDAVPLVSVRPSSSPPAAEGVMEPDDWDLPEQPSAKGVEETPVNPPPVAKILSKSVELAPVEPGPAAKTSSKPAEQAPIKLEPAAAKSSSKTASKTTQTTAKGRQIGAVKKSVQAAKPQAAHDLDSEWAGDFFAADPQTQALVDDYHDHDELIDERRLRSLSPEVRARRAKYRRMVLGLFVAMVLLLAAAIALKLLHDR